MCYTKSSSLSASFPARSQYSSFGMKKNKKQYGQYMGTVRSARMDINIAQTSGRIAHTHVPLLQALFFEHPSLMVSNIGQAHLGVEKNVL